MPIIAETSKLVIYDFGRKLLETNDLDPVYVLLWEARLDTSTLQRWLLAYWCFYNVGTASWITSQIDYWQAMETAAGLKDYPRCHERRHFRGKNATSSVAWLKRQGVDNLFEPFGQGPTTYSISLSAVMKYVQTWVGFGPWIAFKVADMLERLALCNIGSERFTGATFLFESPRKGANLLWDVEGQPHEGLNNQGPWAVNRILQELGTELSPPRYERPINVQECETILCKWHSYMNNHYHIGEDIQACRKGLLKFARCSLIQRLLAAGKQGGLW